MDLLEIILTCTAKAFVCVVIFVVLNFSLYQFYDLYCIKNNRDKIGELKWFLFRIKSTFKSKKNKIVYWKAYAEALVLRTDLPPENIMVHNYGMFGFAGCYCATVDEDDTPIGYTCHIDDYGNKFMFKVEKVGEPYIAVPEIKCWWTFRAWIHEIGHHINGHYYKEKDEYVKEYEAEKFCLKYTWKCRACSIEDFINIEHSAYKYLTKHIVKHFSQTLGKKVVVSNEIQKFLPYNYLNNAQYSVTWGEESIKPKVNLNGRTYPIEVFCKEFKQVHYKSRKRK